MEEKNIVILVIVIIIAIVVLGLGYMFVYQPNSNSTVSSNNNLNPLASIQSSQIKISSNDNVNGTINVYEYSNIKANPNGTYNLSQFGDYYGLLGWDGGSGSKQSIQIENGKADYTLSNDTQFVYVDSYVTNLNKDYGYDNNNKKITVELFIKGVKKMSSTSPMYSTQADVNFGGQLIDLSTGKTLPDSKLIADTPHSKFKSTSEMNDYDGISDYS